ncbi:hypothetical protein LNP74_32425 [Klebsiella pneumoniae subsp. pneumoniae]|nr:hypothetical protein [Klebsiella pneumoniae subsp. pneumoniae]
MLAGLVGIITPPLIIGATLGLGDWLPYLISMSLLASGIGTFLQSNRVWGIGAGMICMQGTSFAFLGVTVAGGMCGKSQGGGPRDMMAMLFGVNFSRRSGAGDCQPLYRTAEENPTPIITGSVIALIGISLIKVSVINWCGGEKGRGFRQHEQYRARGGHPRVIVLAELRQSRWLRLSSVVVGIAVGCIAAGLSGRPSSQPGRHPVSPADAAFRLAFSLTARYFCRSPWCPRWSVLLEAVGGDLTANSLISATVSLTIALP